MPNTAPSFIQSQILWELSQLPTVCDWYVVKLLYILIHCTSFIRLTSPLSIPLYIGFISNCFLIFIPECGQDVFCHLFTNFFFDISFFLSLKNLFYFVVYFRFLLPFRISNCLISIRAESRIENCFQKLAS